MPKMTKNIVKLRLGAEISGLEGRGSILIHRSQRVKKTVDPPYKYPCNSATSFLVEGSFSAPKKIQNGYFFKNPKDSERISPSRSKTLSDASNGSKLEKWS